jgi:hypothetical protein
MNVVIPDLETEASNVRPGDLAQMAGVEIDDALTSHADEVMMLFDPRIEPGCRTWMADLGDDAELHQSVQDSVDRRS